MIFQFPPFTRTPSFRLSLAFFLGTLYGGLFGPFWPVWLAHRGLSPVAVGLLMSLLAWPKLITNPILGSFIDARGYTHEMTVGVGSTLCGVFCLFFWIESFTAFVVLTLVLSCVAGALGLLLDSSAITQTMRGTVEYGHIRVWGSIAFVLMSMLGGSVVKTYGPEIILPMVAGCCLVGIGGLCASPPSEMPTRTRKSGDFLILLRDPAFLLCMLTASLTQGSHSLLNAFSVLHWTKHGLSGTETGMLWAIGTTAEVFVFFASARLVARLGPTRLLLIAALAASVRWTILGLTTTMAILVLAQMLHAASFACCHLGTMHFIGRHVAADLTTRAQAAYSSLVFGITPGILLYVSGALYSTLEGGAFFVMTLLAIASAFTAYRLRLRHLRYGLDQK